MNIQTPFTKTFKSLISDAPKKAKKKLMNDDKYRVYLGTFDNNEFTWYEVESYKDLHDAYVGFKKYVNTQLKYTDEELKKVWDTGRLDIELMQGTKLLNWVGIYSREASNLTRKEEEEIEEKKSTPK